MQVLPESSFVFKSLLSSLKDAKLIVFSGLPGVGKSLYVNSFYNLAKEDDVPIDVIQWDMARKAFETEYIQSFFPMGDGTVHNGLKLAAGRWLMGYLKEWVLENRDNERRLMIEAPLVGHRFVELIHLNENEDLESFLKSEKTHFLIPIPTKEVRHKIEEKRAQQVSDDAKVWIGAKPSVMLMLWKMICGIANEFGQNIDMAGQPEYDHEIYKFVFGQILKNRHYKPLVIDEIFQTNEQNETELHSIKSEVASKEDAEKIVKQIIEQYDDQTIDEIVGSWYKIN